MNLPRRSRARNSAPQQPLTYRCLNCQYVLLLSCCILLIADLTLRLYHLLQEPTASVAGGSTMIYAERTGNFRHPAALHTERHSTEVLTHLPRSEWATSLLAARSEWATSLLAAEPNITSFSRISEADAPGTGGFFVAREDVGHASDAVLEFEKDVRIFFLNALNTAKARDGGTCRALDIGSNGGFFALLARASGCEVFAIDAQPRCIQRLASASAINGWTSGLTAVWAALGMGAVVWM
jgi:hypothetical protein